MRRGPFRLCYLSQFDCGPGRNVVTIRNPRARRRGLTRSRTCVDDGSTLNLRVCRYMSTHLGCAHGGADFWCTSHVVIPGFEHDIPPTHVHDVQKIMLNLGKQVDTLSSTPLICFMRPDLENKFVVSTYSSRRSCVKSVLAGYRTTSISLRSFPLNFILDELRYCHEAL